MGEGPGRLDEMGKSLVGKNAPAFRSILGYVPASFTSSVELVCSFMHRAAIFSMSSPRKLESARAVGRKKKEWHARSTTLRA